MIVFSISAFGFGLTCFVMRDYPHFIIQPSVMWSEEEKDTAEKVTASTFNSLRMMHECVLFCGKIYMPFDVLLP